MSGQRQSWTYTWNGQDRLTTVTRPDGQQWRYRYDALGRRVEKTRLSTDGEAADTTLFTWDGTVQRRSDRCGSDLHGEADQDGTDAEFWAIVTDLTGTPQELVSSNGTIDWAQRTLLWGRPLGTGDADGSGDAALCPIGFPGQYHDAETGFNYNNQRYYDPDTGYYLSPDPQGLDAAPHPQRYISNPLTLTDPPRPHAVRSETCPEDRRRTPSGRGLNP